jgi:hypothetical protein
MQPLVWLLGHSWCADEHGRDFKRAPRVHFGYFSFLSFLCRSVRSFPWRIALVFTGPPPWRKWSVRASLCVRLGRDRSSHSMNIRCFVCLLHCQNQTSLACRTFIFAAGAPATTTRWRMVDMDAVQNCNQTRQDPSPPDPIPLCCPKTRISVSR